MNKEKREKQAQQRAKDKFNSESNSVKVHNQNQGHNVKEEGIGRQNNKYQYLLDGLQTVVLCCQKALMERNNNDNQADLQLLDGLYVKGIQPL